MVTFGSVVGTIFMYSMPRTYASCGTQSTGTRSIRFIRKTHTKMVRARGAMMALLWVKMDLQVSSMNSTSISTAFWRAPGTPAVACLAALRKIRQKRTPRPIDQPMESTLIERKLMDAPSAQGANCHAPSEH